MFVFKQKTAYEMRSSDWSSDVCSSDLLGRDKYGLQAYGEFFGVPKPPIDDWENLKYEDYAHRCSEDVKITIKLWERLLDKLRLIYDSDEDIEIGRASCRERVCHCV